MRGGFFFDSGASKGVRVSNTYLLETSFGWNGICIEPNEIFFSELVRNRRCLCLNCCLYDQDGTVDFLENAQVLGGIIGEYDAAHLRQARGRFEMPEDPNGRLVIVRKAARTVCSVLQECATPPVIGYWSLDTEGSEFVILKSFPFDEYSFRVLTVEHNWLPVRERIRQFLERRGYRRIATMGCDDCYSNQDISLRPPWRSNTWSRLRKGLP